MTGLVVGAGLALLALGVGQLTFTGEVKGRRLVVGGAMMLAVGFAMMVALP